jgi:serine protease Do
MEALSELSKIKLGVFHRAFTSIGFRSVSHTIMRMPLCAVLLVTSVSTLLSGTGAVAQTERPVQKADSYQALKNDPLHVFSQSVQGLSSTVTKSVVQVLTVGFGLSSGEGKTDTAYLAPERGIGAGVLLSSDGFIVTNAHVVTGARKIRVRLQGLDKPGMEARAPHGPIEAKLVGIDRPSDLAVLKIDMTNLPALTLADSSQLKQGQFVLAFGSPLGLENSVSMGVVSATSRQIDPDNPAIYIQTDAPINPGNSGGPLVDVDGQVVGINTFILSQSGGNEGLGFAIPSNVVRNIYEQLRTEGHVHRAQIGVFVRTITPDLVEGLHLPRNRGVLLEDVSPGSPAEKGGMKIGDVVTTIGGKPVDNVRDFSLLLYEYKIGQVANIGILRGGKSQVLSVTLAERPDDPQRFADMLTGPDNLIESLGIVVLNIDDELRDLLGELRIPGGVLVAARTPSSSLLGDDLKAGDVIHSVGMQPVNDIAQLKQSLEHLTPGNPIVLQVERSGSLRYAVMETE